MRLCNTKTLIRTGASLISIAVFTGCSTLYVLENAIHQAALLSRRQPIDDIISSENTQTDLKRRLQLVKAAKHFAESELGLKKTKNYTSFVQLDSSYVTTVVSAAPVDQLEHFQWWFPIVGSVPYKGFFDRKKALIEADELEADGLDVFVRGVSAYSTLGWFNDPVLSSMTDRGSDYDLVELIIHELFHTTVFVPGGTAFNERLATFFARKATDLLFTRWAQGATGQPQIDLLNELKNARDNEADMALIAAFLAEETVKLKEWYRLKSEGAARPIQYDANQLATFRAERTEVFRALHSRYLRDIKPKLKAAKRAEYFEAELRPESLNNARLMAWTLYESDFSILERKWSELGSDPIAFVKWAKDLKTAP